MSDYHDDDIVDKLIDKITELSQEIGELKTVNDKLQDKIKKLQHKINYPNGKSDIENTEWVIKKEIEEIGGFTIYTSEAGNIMYKDTKGDTYTMKPDGYVHIKNDCLVLCYTERASI